MRSPRNALAMALALGIAASPAIAAAQTSDPPPVTATGGALTPPVESIGSERVVEYDLSGPRLGATFSPTGTVRSQFGWHFEHQAGPGTRGPWFIVETILLVGGLEDSHFIPNGNLIFGVRLPNSLEFGVGPSVTLGGSNFTHSGIVLALGQSYRAGGIRVPVNLAVALDPKGNHQVSIMTGWAIRNVAALR